MKNRPQGLKPGKLFVHTDGGVKTPPYSDPGIDLP